MPVVDPHIANVSLSLPFNADAEDPFIDGVVTQIPGLGYADNGDPYRNNVVLNMRMNGTNGSTTFVEDTGKTITPTGTSISTTQSKFGGASAYFVGTTYNTSYLDVPHSIDIVFGTGDFTIEAWVCITGDSIVDGWGNRGAGICGTSIVGTNSWHFVIGGNATTTGTYIGFESYTSSVYKSASKSVSISKNQWYHIAVSRVSGVIYFFLDGVSLGSATYPENITTADSLNIGRIANSGYSWSFPLIGYIDDFRITKGVGRYSTNFTPPTLEIPTINASSLWNSSVGAAVTKSGWVAPAASSKKFGDASLLLDGANGGYLSLAASQNYSFFIGDFTIEFWTNVISGSGTRITNRTTGTGQTGTWSISLHPGGVIFSEVVTGEPNVFGSHTFTPGTWYHVAVTRSSGMIRIFVDGVLKNSGSLTTNFNYSSNALYIGKDGSSGATGLTFEIQDFRITKGAARYISNFTPPTSPNPYNTLLLNKVTRDFSPNTKTVTRVQSAVASPYVQKNGLTSASFGGDGYMSVTQHADLNLTSGDFTVECWFNYRALSGGSMELINKDGVYDAAYSQYSVAINSTGNLYGTIGSGNGMTSQAVVIGNTVISANVWHHAALVKNGTILSLFLDGKLEGFVAAATMVEGNKPLLIGYHTGQPSSRYFNGYIDDVRITKGVARYKSDVVTPTSTDVETLEPAFNDEASEVLGYGSSTGEQYISFEKGKGGGTSLYLNGTSDYVNYFTNSSHSLLNLDFCVEAWVYQLSNSVDRPRIINFGNTWDTTDSWAICAGHSSLGPNKYVVHVYGHGGNTTALLTSTSTLKLNQWCHVAVTRSGNIFKLFIDGVEEATNTWSGSVNTSSSITSCVGACFGTSPETSYFHGYIDDLRVTKGHSRYTSNFTPPDNIPKVEALFKNEIPKKRVMAQKATLTTNHFKFGTASADFTKVGAYGFINYGPSIGTGDFTIECWFKLASQVGTRTYFSISNIFKVHSNPNGPCIFLNSLYNTTQIVGTTVPTIGVWYHLALTRQSGTVRMFLNGVQEGTSVVESTNLATEWAMISDFTEGSELKGYMDEFRLSKGVARYTSNFAVPTSAFPNDPSDSAWSSVKVLCHFEPRDTSQDALANFVSANRRFDSPFPPNSLDVHKSKVVLNYSFDYEFIFEELGSANSTTSGVTLVESPTKNGTAVKFDSTVAYIATNTTKLKFGTNDFTIEGWFYLSGSGSGYEQIFLMQGGGKIFYLRVSDDAAMGRLQMSVDEMSSWANVYSTGISKASLQNVWTHFSMERYLGRVYLFINGVLQTLGTGSSGPTNTTTFINYPGEINNTEMIVGRGRGYQDGFRVTVGVARRMTSSNFTPNPIGFDDVFTISGVVKDDTNTPCARKVRAHRSNQPEVYKETISNATTGVYEMDLPPLEHYLIFFDDAAGTQHNALILDKVVPG
jgi:hypothetical protein